jgi:hypothetical protein
MRLLTMVYGAALFLLGASGLAVARQAQGACEQTTVDENWGPAYASKAKEFLSRLQGAVKANNQVQFSLLVQYPVHVHDTTRNFEIRTAQDLIAKYPSVVTRDVKHAILTQPADCLFANADGVMIGNGQVWFQSDPAGNMKIVAINVSAAKF